MKQLIRCERFLRMNLMVVRAALCSNLDSDEDIRMSESDCEESVDNCYRGALQERSSEFRHFRSPPKSPDINIIDYILDALQRAVQKRSPPLLTPNDLLTALQDSWCARTTSDIKRIHATS
ncbi:transposable element tcb2 transposase [Trichonephila clavipes]|nr:transposable element tcb2 transposase [Trichonephila clavipes]